MKRQSLKKQKERRVSTRLENAIKENIADTCEVCGRVGNLDRHHIAAGAHRRELANFRSTIYVCRSCHNFWQSEPVVEQFGLLCLITAKAINREFGCNKLDMEKIEKVVLESFV